MKPSFLTIFFAFSIDAFSATATVAIPDLSVSTQVTERIRYETINYSNKTASREKLTAAASASSNRLDVAGQHTRENASSTKLSRKELDGNWTYVKQDELGWFSSEIKNAFLTDGRFRLINPRKFDYGERRTSSARAARNIAEGDRIRETDENDLLDYNKRIKNGEFDDAELVLFSRLIDIRFSENTFKFPNSDSQTIEASLTVLCDFQLVNRKTLEVIRAFQVQSDGADTVIASPASAPSPNRLKMLREVSVAIGKDVKRELAKVSYPVIR